jgi:hypothetical protein
VIETFDAKMLIDRRPLNLKLERQRTPTSVLAFPGKVLADEKSKRLFIADSNHNRIVVVSLEDSSVKEVIGSGQIGLADGTFDAASFNHPQGMALDGSTLFVADTENHAIRAVDLEKKTVTTIAGTGEQLRRRITFGGQGKDIALNSPWDLTVQNGILYIAIPPSSGDDLKQAASRLMPAAGAKLDRRPRRSRAGQPRGITGDGKKLYFAIAGQRDTFRGPDPSRVGRSSPDLFGPSSRQGSAVRLHPGVTYNGWLYVADTYNNKISASRKRIVRPRHLGPAERNAWAAMPRSRTGGVSVAGNLCRRHE